MHYPLTLFSLLAEAVYRGMALGATCELGDGWVSDVPVPPGVQPQGAAARHHRVRPRPEPLYTKDLINPQMRAALATKAFSPVVSTISCPPLERSSFDHTQSWPSGDDNTDLSDFPIFPVFCDQRPATSDQRGAAA